MADTATTATETADTATTDPEATELPVTKPAEPRPARHARRARFSRKWQARTILGVILLVAILFRTIGTRFGFPLLLHPDEWAVVKGVVEMAKHNSFEPPWNMRPDHVEMKLDYLLFAGYSAVFKHQPIEVAFAHHPLPFYWIARLATASFGVATVVLAYLIGRLTSVRLGLIMAALFAVFPAFVLHAHYATPDVPVTFALVLLTYALMRYVRSASRKSLLWASFAVALGIATKYPAAVGGLMIEIVVLAVGIRDKSWRRLVKHAFLAVGATFGFLFAISPSLFTNFTDVRHQLSGQADGHVLGHPDLGYTGNLRFYVNTYLDYSGIVLAVLALVGVVLVIRSRQLDRLPWLVGLLVWGSLSRLPLTWERWGVPMWITPLLFAAVALAYLVDRFRSRRTVWIPLAVSFVVAAQLITNSLVVDAGLLAPETRNASLAYTRSHGITQANTIYEGYSPLLPGAPKLFFAQVTAVPGGYEFHTDAGTPATYAIMSSGMYGRVFADRTETANQQIYRWIFAHAKLVARFAPMSPQPVSDREPVAVLRNLKFVKKVIDGGVFGPTIMIYRLPPPSR